MPAGDVVREGLQALSANRPTLIPGRMNRMMRAIVPPSVTRSMMMRMFDKMPALANPRP
jgi:short-subunit dehydrogenase